MQTWRSVERIEVLFNLTTVTGTLHEDRCTFMIISRCILLRMRNVSDQSCRENQNKYFMFNNFFPQNRAVYEIMWGKCGRARQATDDNITWRMRLTCRIAKARIHAHIILNSFCISTATVVTRTRRRVSCSPVLCTTGYVSFKSAWAPNYRSGFTRGIQVLLSVTVPCPERDPYTSVSQPLWDRGPVNSFFIRRRPGPNRFTRKYLSNFF